MSRRLLGVLAGRHSVQRTVRSNVVVVLSPGFDDLAGVLQAREPVQVQAEVPELAVEALDEGVLVPWFRTALGPLCGAEHRVTTCVKVSHPGCS